MKDPAAVKLGRKGGRARAAQLSPAELSEIGRKAAIARWGNDRPRCYCGVMTAAAAKKQGHHCEAR